MKRGRKRKRVGAPPKKAPWDSVVSPQGTRAHLTCQLRTWEKSGGRADLKPEELPGELGRGEWALSRGPAVQFFSTQLHFHQGSCWLMPQNHRPQDGGLEAGPRPQLGSHPLGSPAGARV